MGNARQYTLDDSATPMEVEAVAATLVVVRRELFDQLGGFDERFFMYMEDTDLSYRAHKAGYHNVFLPMAGAVHQWAKGSEAGRVRRLYYHHRSVWKYFGKHFPGVASMIMLAPMLFVNFLLTAVFGTRQSGKS
jgi:GT2 family glycosyltransferase